MNSYNDDMNSYASRQPVNMNSEVHIYEFIYEFIYDFNMKSYKL